jgi:hypothetical protein
MIRGGSPASSSPLICSTTSTCDSRIEVTVEGAAGCNQPLLLVVAQSPWGYAGTLRELSDSHVLKHILDLNQCECSG